MPKGELWDYLRFSICIGMLLVYATFPSPQGPKRRCDGSQQTCSRQKFNVLIWALCLGRDGGKGKEYLPGDRQCRMVYDSYP